MLYRTHKKFGYTFGFAALILSFINGWMVAFNQVGGFYDKAMVFILAYTAIRGAVFGSGFPDIDSPGSVPARHYPFLRRVFKLLNIKHRGPVSHDYVTVTVIFIGLYFGVNWLIQMAFTNPWLMVVLAFYVCYNFSRDMMNNIVFKLVKDKKKRKTVLALTKPLVAVVLFIVFVTVGFIRMGTSPANLVGTSNFIGPVLRQWIIFGWVGAMSHLFADMLTNDGVHFLGFDVAPAKIVLLVKKLPLIGKYLISNDMKTGSSYEDGWNLVVTVMMVPLFLLAVMGMMGGDVTSLVALLGGV